MSALQERRLRYIVLVLFFLSGATGLVYEVIWIRLLSLVFGNTVHAISTVLTVFWTGLAAGAYLAGRWIDRHPDPLRIYGLLEGGIGLYCAATPAILTLLTPAYVAVARSWPEASGLFLGTRFALGFAVLLIPATCMGATLPIIAKFYVRRFETVGRGVGLLYGLNTVGAVVGCFASGFVSLPLVGVSRTLWVTAAINILVALAALTISLQTEPIVPAPASTRARPTPYSRWLLIAFGLAGFASLVYEVVWTRVLVLIIGSTVYAYTTMLTTFILGIGLGSLLIAPLLDRSENLLVWFAGLEIAIGIWALVSLPLFGVLPEAFVKGYALIGPSWKGIVGMKFAFSALVMLPATLCMGGTFPIVCRLYTERLEGIGSSVGTVYAANTIGAIGGSFLTGFVAIPWLGTQLTIVLAAILNTLIAAGLCLSASKLTYKRRLGFVLGGGLMVALLTVGLNYSWDRQLMASGVFHMAPKFGSNPGNFREKILSRELLYFAEGPAATVMVTRRGSLMNLKINGKVVASTNRHDMLNQLYLGHLPVLFHPDPRSVLVIGLGAGVTSGAVASHPVERIDIVEIAPSVPAAAQLFEEENDRVLDDPRVRLIIADGRNQLLVARTRYDVITADPIHPWTAGASSLYSEDHYRLAKARLKPGGIMCQWLPLYEMDPGSARTIVRTFSAVFPYTTIWSNGFSDAIMIGTDQPLRIDVEAFSKRFHRQAIRANLTQIDVKSPWSLLAGFLLDKGAVDAYAGDAAMNTDDRPILEFVAPKSIYVDTVPSNLLALLRQRATLGPYLVSADDLASQAIERRFYATGEVLEGWAKARLGKEREAEALFERALAVDPDHLLARRLMSRLLVKRGEIAIGRGRLEEAKSTLDRALSLYPSFKAHVALGTVYALGEQLNAAILEYRRALELEPDADAAHKNLGLALIKAGQHENEAKRHLQRALVLNPTDPEAGKVRLIIKHLSANKTAPQK